MSDRERLVWLCLGGLFAALILYCVGVAMEMAS